MRSILDFIFASWKTDPLEGLDHGGWGCQKQKVVKVVLDGLSLLFFHILARKQNPYPR